MSKIVLSTCVFPHILDVFELLMLLLLISSRKAYIPVPIYHLFSLRQFCGVYTSLAADIKGHARLSWEGTSMIFLQDSQYNLYGYCKQLLC